MRYAFQVPGPVAVVETIAREKGNLEIATEYLSFLYAPASQRLIARHYFRPAEPSHADPVDLARFPKIEQVGIDAEFGGWAAAQKAHFDDGGSFDRIYRVAK